MSGEYLAVSKAVSLAREGRIEFNRTLVETSSSLEWMTDYIDPLSYAQALDVAREIGQGWRLPTMQELYALVDHSRMAPTVREPFACHHRGGVFWTNTGSCYSHLDIWCVDFEYGYAVLKSVGEKAFVRLVRTKS